MIPANAAEAGSTTEPARGTQLPEFPGWGERTQAAATEVTSWT